MVVEAAAVVLFVFRRSDEDIAALVREVPDIRDGYVHALVFRALDKGGEAVVVSSDINGAPVVSRHIAFR